MENQISDLKEALISTLKGDVSAFSFVRSASQTELRQAFTEISDIEVTREAVIRVLRSWDNRQYPDEQIHKWASFIRRGYLENKNDTPIMALDIQYRLDDEGVISHVISRLDQIGDRVDGIIDHEERQQLIGILIQ